MPDREKEEIAKREGPAAPAVEAAGGGAVAGKVGGGQVVGEAAVERPAEPARPPRQPLRLLALAALGVVFGDIGTSPLYAIKVAFAGPLAIAPTRANVLGVLSLIFWALVLIVVVKYLTFVVRAENRGEGGVLALMALVAPMRGLAARRRLLVVMGLFGAALLYGDGVITPAISVLGAMEGLQVAAPPLERLIVPLAIVILVGLFLFQRRGTAGVGAVFGPVILIWFASIAATGVWGLVRHPGALAAVHPYYAVEFFQRNQWAGFLTLGAVFLVVTGTEALYADIGHFGVGPIRLAWYSVVLPALLLNYFGQGALVIAEPSTARNPFFELAPSWGRVPMLLIATSAAIIASQAVISGAFSLTRQAVQLGYLPRLTVVHTSPSIVGQIYVPEVNRLLMIACVALVLGFKESSNLAYAYGVAVAGTMVITTMLLSFLARRRWRWGLVRLALLIGLFLLIDTTFLSANLIKIGHGGWFPLALGVGLYTVMTTWKQGRTWLAQNERLRSLPFDLFLADIAKHRPVRVPGTAVFMSRDPEGVPPAVLHHFKHNKVFHEQVVILSVVWEEVPRVSEEERVETQALGQGFFRVAARYGFMETPNVPTILEQCRAHGLEFKLMETTFYLARATLLTTGKARIARWRKNLFAFMARNARPATAFFGIPPNRVVELGAHIEL